MSVKCYSSDVKWLILLGCEVLIQYSITFKASVAASNEFKMLTVVFWSD
jgi:hypothetical protein